MALPDDPVVARMQSLIDQWEAIADQRAIFLTCYRMMTSNMLSSLEQGKFLDSSWVDHLLRRFADYYFVALEAYEQNPVAAPPVWQLAHNAARNPDVLSLQKLMVGVNAHINHYLVFTVVELLQAEWPGLTAEQRAGRYAHFCQVNEVIGQTIDAVQDQVLEPNMPAMDFIDRFFGPIDELLISSLINHWRDDVWHNAVLLLETGDSSERAQFVEQVEQDALQLGKFII